MSEVLFWSKHGEVACASHAPETGSERWRLEHWRRIPDDAHGRQGSIYQCPQCAPDGRSHRRVHPAE